MEVNVEARLDVERQFFIWMKFDPEVWLSYSRADAQFWAKENARLFAGELMKWYDEEQDARRK